MTVQGDLTQQTVPSSRYCTTCGALLVDGTCTSCRSTPSVTTQHTDRTRTIVVGLILALLIGSSGIVLTELAQRDSSGRDATLHAQLRADETMIRALRERADATDAGSLALSRRIDTLEANAT